ncbi:MFS transporter [uncultured Alsobacter sp.]|uniref:MFS transporter n=1 Tax=uncultured Alsobacter sp. TaxID=1748258 RepID=UPI0025CBAB34|nr:MFS transporter [uncultured Alsobacter sp.]
MTASRWASVFSPFAVRSFRFQWSADLVTSWAFEMENVLLGWYIVVKTQSVLMVTLYGTMQFLGTLIAPFFGLAGDRLGQRTVICAIRACFVALSSVGTLLTLTDNLSPVLVLVIAGVGGLVRPSDTGIRNLLIAETIPPGILMRAISLSRITQDSARAAGALASGAIVLVLGMSVAYPVAVAFYALGALLSFGAGVPRPVRTHPLPKLSPFGDLRDAARAVWQHPQQLAAMIMAFALNMTAFPFTLGLLPYVARDVYGTTQAGLGYMVAAVACGSIVASVITTARAGSLSPARTMLVCSLVWHALLVVFGQVHGLAGGLVLLGLIGLAQMMCMLPLSLLLLRSAPVALRGRIMGMRTLAVYGLPIGLLGTGPLIDTLGFPATATLYGLAGTLATLAVLVRWREHLWARDAEANSG